jgi:hypothetical protein
MLKQIFLDLLFGAGAHPGEPGVASCLLEVFTGRLAGPVAEVLGSGSDKSVSKLGPPSLTQPLLDPGQHTALLFLDVVVHRLDQLIKGRGEFGRLRVHRCHLFKHVLSLGVLTLAVRHFVSLACLVLGNWIDFSLLGSRMRNEQGAQHGEVQAPRGRLLLQQVKQALDLAMVILDQLDNICSGHVPSP